jgi:hypothetical protein
MLAITRGWWPCIACQSLEHSFDRCPDVKLGHLRPNVAHEVICLYRAGRIEEAELTARMMRTEACYKCGQPGHRYD